MIDFYKLTWYPMILLNLHITSSSGFFFNRFLINIYLHHYVICEYLNFYHAFIFLIILCWLETSVWFSIEMVVSYYRKAFLLSPLHKMLFVGLLYMPIIRLRNFLSNSCLTRTFVENRCWILTIPFSVYLHSLFFLILILVP